MKEQSVMAEIDRLIPLCKDMAAAGKTMDQIIKVLRDQGMDKAETTYLLANALNQPVGNLKSIVLRSPVWEDRYKDDEQFLDMVEKTIREKPSK
jgi:hypothetical protein